jgi:hypothetical protein
MVDRHVFPTRVSEVAAFCLAVLGAGRKYIKELPFADEAFWNKFEEYIKQFTDAVKALEIDKGSQTLFLRRNTAMKWLKDAVKRIHGFVKNHSFTTDAILQEFCFHIPKKYHTKATPPVDSVEATFTKHKTDHIHVCQFRILDSTGRGCGDIYDRVELRIFVGDNDSTPPANPEDYPRREELRRSPTNIIFPPEQAGMIAYYVARFINKVGMKGPWTILKRERIP